MSAIKYCSTKNLEELRKLTSIEKNEATECIKFLASQNNGLGGDPEMFELVIRRAKEIDMSSIEIIKKIEYCDKKTRLVLIDKCNCSKYRDIKAKHGEIIARVVNKFYNGDDESRDLAIKSIESFYEIENEDDKYLLNEIINQLKILDGSKEKMFNEIIRRLNILEDVKLLKNI